MNTFIILIQFLIYRALSADLNDFLNAKLNSQTINNNYNNNGLSSDLINDLLAKCSKLESLDECDMCSLCQNGAFCKQKTKKPTFTPLLTSTKSNLNSLALLRSLIDFTCYCVPGYTGTYCQIDINECLSSPCSNNSTCIDGINTYECKCPPGFTGDHCEININECESSPCNSNGGKCVDLVDGYYCSCNPGFTGPTCSINIDECFSQPCLNNGTCVDRINDFECNCTGTGFEGALCENNINDCKDVQCRHNSVCIDGINSFKCDCYPGFDGKYCEIDIDECQSSPCVYGTCWQNSDENSFSRKVQLLNHFDQHQLQASVLSDLDLSIKLNLNYSKAAGFWCECEPGYTGVNCEIKIDECLSSPCGPNGKCIDLVNGYKCLCYPGYTGRTCMENIDECKMFSPCANRTKCVDLKPDYASYLHREDELAEDIYLDGYYCDCSDLNENLFRKNGNRDVIYAGQNCTLKLNACENLKHKCKHDSVCQSILFNSTEQDIMCLCKSGYTGKYCEYSTVFRMDGTYFIDQKINFETSNKLNFKFDFRLNFLNKFKHPLIYFENNGSLMYEFIVHQDYLEIRNQELNLREKLGFLYLKPTEFYQTMWNSIEIILDKEENQIQIFYNIKQLHLNVFKNIQIVHSELRGLLPDMFRIGKYFNKRDAFALEESTAMEFKNENYLSDTCFRDFNLNGEYLFKTLSLDYLNLDFEDVNDGQQKVKFGCNLNNKMFIKENQCKNDGSSKNACLHRSNCLNKWFDYECMNCSLPFYGKNCQFESSKLVLLGDKLNLNMSNINSFIQEKYLNWFKIEFKIHRFVYDQFSESDSSNFDFLILNQSNTSFVVSVNRDGFLTLKKFDFSEPTKGSWSLNNDKINLNQFCSSYSSKISIKLSNNLVELNVNNTYVNRFEFVNLQEQADRFNPIEQIQFSNFSTSNILYLLYDLQINDNTYQFRKVNNEKNLKFVVLDRKLNYLYEESVQNQNLILYNATQLDDFSIVESLNKINSKMCDRDHINDIYDILNQNSSLNSNFSSIFKVSSNRENK